MGLRINSNIAALSSYNNLNKTDKAVSSSLEKLSSGYRINKAADDAAGLVTSEGLKSQIGGLTVAARNAQDGVNVVQTADGALSTVTDILQRMRDLAVQAANTGSSDATATAAANTEFAQLSQEIDRIATTTSFGGLNLLDGTYGTKPATASAVVTGNSITVATGGQDFKITAPSGTVQTVTIAAGTYSGAQLASALQSGIQSALSQSASATDKAAASKFTVTSSMAGTSAALSINYAGPAASTFTLAAGTVATGGDLLASIGISTPASAVVAASGTGGKFQIGANAAVGANDQALSVSITAVSTTALGVSGFDLTSTNSSTTTNASAAITAVSNALATVSSQRATLGATQNRFEKTIDNLNTAIQNITASNSAIRDTDMAAEMTKFTKNQVLAQAGTSMLAQANSSTQNILTLLRG